MKQASRSESSTSAGAALSAKDLRGIFLPITTPFHTDGAIDVNGLRSNIRKWNDEGISGYIVLGSTGERVNLDEREQLEVLEAARSEVPAGKGGLTFVAGVGQQSTRATIEEIKRVNEAVSPDAVLVITPHFYRSAITQAALTEHYQRAADESPAPLILYSMPALTGIKIEPETAALLSEHENIIGIKDSSADLEGFAKIIRLVREDFAVLTGNGTVLFEALRAGARGAILAVGCVVPALCIEIFRAVAQGDIDRAARLQSQLTPLATAVTTRFGIGGLKTALELKGYVGGMPRAPLKMPSDEALAEIALCLEEAEKASQETSSSRLAISQ